MGGGRGGIVDDRGSRRGGCVVLVLGVVCGGEDRRRVKGFGGGLGGGRVVNWEKRIESRVVGRVRLEWSKRV